MPEGVVPGEGPGMFRTFFLERVGWYAYPLIYVLVTSVVLGARGPGLAGGGVALRAVWMNIVLVPGALAFGAVTLAALGAAALDLRRSRARPDGEVAEHAEHAEHADRAPGGSKKSPSRLGRAAGLVGFVLLLAGVAVMVWVARPYVTLLMSSGRTKALEEKARTGAVSGDWIIIPSVLVDAPVLEGFTERNLARGIAHLSETPVPGQGGNVVLEGHNLAEVGLSKSNNLFSLLELVGEGARVYVFHGGKRHVYKVTRKDYMDVGSPRIYADGHGEKLTMVTCVSTWSPTIYTRRRTVVTAVPDR